MAGRYDAVVFDLLTALLDSWTLWNSAAGSAEDGQRWRQRYLELTYGAGRYVAYDSLVATAALEAGLDTAAAWRLLQQWDTLAPWPEAPEILRVIGGKVRLGIVTNCSVLLGGRAAARMGIAFDAVVTAEAAGYYKPRPAPYLAVLAALGTSPGRTLFVAGSAADVPGASAVGMNVFWHNRVGMKPIGTVQPMLVSDRLDPLLDLVMDEI